MKENEISYPIEMFIWDDAEASNSWEDIKSISLEKKKVVTVGFVIMENDHHVLISSTISDGFINCTIQIPKNCIYKRMKLLVENISIEDNKEN